ncbi:unnamed protein product [Caenorhabditis auriculariae]|uniref:Uncharacterized protein n=1 Tax=Caenorhabditis auriculariae TaxID=2777116 RepID=A0A8S1GNY2_9PELO|nr:unnamed protein product [Caenorhabditis auriculariae]
MMRPVNDDDSRDLQKMTRSRRKKRSSALKVTQRDYLNNQDFLMSNLYLEDDEDLDFDGDDASADETMSDALCTEFDEEIEPKVNITTPKIKLVPKRRSASFTTPSSNFLQPESPPPPKNVTRKNLFRRTPEEQRKLEKNIIGGFSNCSVQRPRT